MNQLKNSLVIVQKNFIYFPLLENFPGMWMKLMQEQMFKVARYIIVKHWNSKHLVFKECGYRDTLGRHKNNVNQKRNFLK